MARPISVGIEPLRWLDSVDSNKQKRVSEIFHEVDDVRAPRTIVILTKLQLGHAGEKANF